MAYKKRIDLSQYNKVDHVLSKLEEYFEKGFKIFNVYHFRKSDDLCIQLKNGSGASTSLTFKCTYPVFRFPTKQLALEDNIFRSLYYLPQNRCNKVYVPSSTINGIGKIDFKPPEDEDEKRAREEDPVNKHFHPERFLVYNVLRPEYYITTTISNDHNLSYEETRIGSLDIEISNTSADFPEPKKAEYPIALLSVFDFNTNVAHVFYLNGHNIDTSLDEIHRKIKENMPNIKLDYSVNMREFNNELDLITALIDFLNENYDIVVGWNVNEFDMEYITNRSKKLGTSLEYNIVYDGFGPSFVFRNFFVIDYISVYKFFVKKNLPSMKLADIANATVGISKIESDTFLDIAYNITDNMLVYLIDKELSLIKQMFSFKSNGAVLHVFNVKNALEPLIIKRGAESKGVFIANQYTNYYNIYFNEVYKFINREILELPTEELIIRSMKDAQSGGITYFLTHLHLFADIIIKYLASEKKDEKDGDDVKEDTAGVILSKLVEKIFKKPRVKKPPKPKKTPKKRKKKGEVAEPEPEVADLPLVEEPQEEESTPEEDALPAGTEVDISTLSCKKNFHYETESFDHILVKLFSINIDTIYGYPGAFNKSFRGVETDLVDLDLYSMYPVIMYALNISIETTKFLAPMKLCVLRIYNRELYEEYVSSQGNRVVVYDTRGDRFGIYGLKELESIVFNSDSIIANTGMIFCKKVGFIPKMCENFLVIRAKYKDKMAEESDPVLKGKYNIYQLLYKVYNNSIYGYMGYKYSLLFNRLLVSSVTVMGRSEILYANYKITEYLGGEERKSKISKKIADVAEAQKNAQSTTNAVE